MRTTARPIHFPSIAQATFFLETMGCDVAGVKIMAPKAMFHTIFLEQVPSRAANLLKQTFLAKGGEVAVARGTADLSVPHTPALICATQKQYRLALAQLKLQPWGLPDIAAIIESALQRFNTAMYREYRWKDMLLKITQEQTLVMGVLNITPDSFSDGGRYNNQITAVDRVRQMISEGADIIDIGAESTRPYGAVSISAEKELDRLLPVLKAILEVSTVPISVDTYKAEVAEEALRLGAHIINDIWGLQADPRMAEVAADHQVPVIVMHNRQEVNPEIDIMYDLVSFFYKSVEIAEKAGIQLENLILDPGFGFGKSIDQNLVILRNMEQLASFGCPVLVGTSRKRFIGETLGLPVEDRMEGTGATVCQSIIKGAKIVRVHDVLPIKRMTRMMDAILARGEVHGQN